MAVTLKIDAAVAVITFDTDRMGNLIDQEAAHQMSLSLGEADASRDVNAIVLTGSGDCFSEGVDLEALSAGDIVRSPQNGFAGVTERRVSKPLIAAVEGPALAEGFEMALACDLLVAADDALFGLGQVTRGALAESGGLLRLPELLPPKLARELIFTGEAMPAQRLYAHGLVNRLVPRGASLAEAVAMASGIAKNPGRAVVESKRVLDELVCRRTRKMFAQQRSLISYMLNL